MAGINFTDKNVGAETFHRSNDWRSKVRERDQQIMARDVGDMIASESIYDALRDRPEPARAPQAQPQAPAPAPQAPDANYLNDPGPDEADFQKWMGAQTSRDPDPNYQYRRAYRTGAEPDANGQWPDRGTTGLELRPPAAQPLAAPAAAQPQQQGRLPNVYTSLAQRLARAGAGPNGVRGLGQQAMQAFGAADQRQTRDEQRLDQMRSIAIKALATGDMVTFDYYAKQSGLNLPPQLLQDGNTRQLFSRGTMLAEKFYKEDGTQSGNFVRAYMQSGGNVDAAYAAVGAPRFKPNITVDAIRQGDQDVLAFIDRANQTVTPAQNAQGQPIPYQRRPVGRQGAVPAEIQMRNWIMENMVDPATGQKYTAQQADFLARTSKGNPEALAIRYATGKSGINNTTGSARVRAQEQFDRFYREFMDSYRRGAGGAPTQPSQPGPGGAPAPAAAPQRVPVFNPQTGSFE